MSASLPTVTKLLLSPILSFQPFQCYYVSRYRVNLPTRTKRKWYQDVWLCPSGTQSAPLLASGDAAWGEAPEVLWG